MLEDILVPIFICVVLPVSIVLIVFMTRRNSDNKRAEILIKAIETGSDINADKLAEALRKPMKQPKSAREILNMRLLRGCLGAFIGLALCTVSIVSLCNGSDMSSDNVSIPFMFGGLSLAIGLSYIVVYFVTRKQAN